MSNGKTKQGMMFVMGIILAIVLSVEIWSTGLLIGSAQTKTMINALNQSDYYLKQSDLLEQQIGDFTENCGLPREIVDGVFMTEEILAITMEYTTGCIRGDRPVLNSTAVGERLRANLLQYMEEHQMDKAWISSQNMKDYMDRAGQMYYDTVSNALTNNYQSVIHRMTMLYAIVSVVLILVAVLIVWILYRLSRRRRKTIACVNQALITALILTVGSALYLWLAGSSGVLNISTAVSRGLADRYAAQIAICILFVDIFWFILLIILAVVHRKIRGRRYR